MIVGRALERRQPQHVHVKPFEIIELAYNALQIGFDSDTKQNKGMTISYKENQGNAVTVVGMQLFSIKSRLGSGYWGNDQSW